MASLLAALVILLGIPLGTIFLFENNIGHCFVRTSNSFMSVCLGWNCARICDITIKSAYFLISKYFGSLSVIGLNFIILMCVYFYQLSLSSSVYGFTL